MFRDDERTPRWTLLIPAFLALGIVVGLATADWGARDASFIAWLVVGTIAVGIAEETLTRGLVLTAMRGGMGDIGAWFWSSLPFGLLHGANIVLGQDARPTLQQIVFAFVFGSVLCVAGARRAPWSSRSCSTPCGTSPRSWGARATSQPRRGWRASSPTRP